MADVKVTDYLSSLDTYKFNPAAIQRVGLEVLRNVYDGNINIVDATNPFVFCLENTATNTAAFMIQNEATTRRLYSAAAVTMDDLYLHMSDKDHIGQHATPSKATFKILLNKSELLSRMILDINTGIKKIRIPRNTVFYASDIPFSLQYPVDIRQPAHGGLQASYIVNQVSPLKTLTTNAIDVVELRNSDGTTYVQIEVEVDQFFVEQRTNDVSAVSGFTTDIPLTDSFYHLRCYVQNEDNTYTEINVTHTSQVYDPFSVTAVVKVLEKTVQVTIPSVYTTTGQITGKLRLDVYQTKGTLTTSLGTYKAEDFKADWINLDENDDDIYTTAISNFRSIVVYSTTDVNGGSAASTFLELKNRVIANTTGALNAPITNVQIEGELAQEGYEIIKNVDTITNRIYLASKALPKPTDESILTPAAAAIPRIQLTLKEAANIYGARDNGKRITLTSKTLYQNKDGITRPLTSAEFNAINNLPVLQKCIDVTAGNYYYSPFTYVLDATLATFEVRSYFIDNPFINTKSFVSENATTGYQASVDSSYSVSKNDTGYVIDIVTKSSDNFKGLDDANVHVRLAFKPHNQTKKVYLTGVLKGKTSTGERLYSFDLNTDYDIDLDDKMVFTNTNGSESAIAIKGALDNDFDVYFCTTAEVPSTWMYSPLDDEINAFDLPEGAYAVSNERLNVILGYRLKGLWALSRSNVTSTPYQVYATDVPAYYKADVYEVDPATGAAFTIDEQGNLVYNILHRRGDPKLDTNGDPIYEHLKGEVVYDEDGNPSIVPGYERDLLRLVDVLTIEAPYYFAIPVDFSSTTNYRTIIAKTLNQWITEDIPSFNERLLDKTEIYFYPKVATGDIEVLTNNNEVTIIPASQSFTVKLMVSPTVYDDTILLTALRSTTTKTIDASLQGKTVSISTIERDLLQAYGDDVIAVEVMGLGGVDTHNTFTVLSNSNRCSIRKRLSALPDNSLTVEEDITIEFVKHGL
jgi:hypothetical protein